MESQNLTPGTDPLDTHDEQRVAGITGMSADSAKTFLDFHTGMRWLHQHDEPVG